jgi:adenylate cyclase
VARRLAEVAGDVVEPPVRLVKTIGDAVMLVSLEPAALVDAALDLVAAADADGSELPQLRAGVAVGEAVAYGGDWYGRPINLASRLTSIARPSSVLATEAVREALPEEGYRFSFAGERRIKGIRGDQKLLRIRRAEPPAEGKRVG